MIASEVHLDGMILRTRPGIYPCEWGMWNVLVIKSMILHSRKTGLKAMFLVTLVRMREAGCSMSLG